MIDIPKVDLSRFVIRSIAVKITHEAPPYTLNIHCVIGVLNVETGVPDYIRSGALFECFRSDPAEDQRRRLHAAIRRCVLNTLEHELSECLYIDDVRVCENPHPELRTPPIILPPPYSEDSSYAKAMDAKRKIISSAFKDWIVK